MGTMVASAAAFGLAYGVFTLLKVVMGVLVSPEEEIEGLDRAKHGNEAYQTIHPIHAPTLVTARGGRPFELVTAVQGD